MKVLFTNLILGLITVQLNIFPMQDLLAYGIVYFILKLLDCLLLGFDSESWYPLGRSVGGTVYPGLMSTSAIVYWTLHKLSFTVDIRNVCVFLAPVFGSFTAVATYLMTKVHLIIK